MTTAETEKEKTQTGATEDVNDETAQEDTGPRSATEAFNKTKTRKYVVLRIETVLVVKDDTPAGVGGPGFLSVGDREAATSKEAVALAKDEFGPGDYVAVAESGWNEHSVKLVEVAPQLVIE